MKPPTPPVFEYLLSSSVAAEYRLLDVQLVDVVEGDDGKAQLIVECQGSRAGISAGVDADDVDRGLIGQVGALSREFDWERPASFRFEPYVDQTLRRAPELDGPDPFAAPGTQPRTVGWRCAQRPAGLRAPVGVIPGYGGAVVEDRSHALQMRIPEEFVELCRNRLSSPEAVLLRFMSDACDLESTQALPRADGLNRSTDKVADLARDWVDAAFPETDVPQSAQGDYGFEVAHADPLAGELDELLDLVQAFVDAGGDAQALAQELSARMPRTTDGPER